MAGPGELLVNVSCGSRRLLSVTIPNTIPFWKFKREIENNCGKKNLRMLYVDEDGDKVCLDNPEEFLEALRVAHSVGQLELIVVERFEHEKPGYSHGKGGTSAYNQLAHDMGERQRVAKEAAHALLAKVPCEGKKAEKREKKESLETEPKWFQNAMRKHTKVVVANIVKELNGAVIASIRQPALVTGPGVACSVIPEEADTALVHRGVVCDGCERAIIGNRYKCGNCLDYDLCDDCEKMSDVLHPATHVFVKIKRPARHAGFTKKGKLKPLLRSNLYGESPAYWSRDVTLDVEKLHSQSKPCREGMHPGPEPKQEPLPKSKEPCQPASGQEECVEQTSHLVRRSKEQLRKDLKKNVEAINEGFMASGVSRPRDQLREELKKKKNEKKQRKEDTLTSPTAVMKGHGKCLDATFITDTSYPDGQFVTYGKPFTKGWIIENSGTKKWKHVKLVHQEGFRPLQPELNIPEVAPGEQVELSVEYPAIAVSDGVEIRSSWKLIHNEKTPFGCVLWLLVVAQPDSLDELAASFEHISYPSLPPSLTEPMASSLGFACFTQSLDDAPAKDKEEEGNSLVEEFSMVEPPTPVLSLTSNDSFHQPPPLTNAENDDAVSISSQCSTDSEFVVVVPDCFNLDVPLDGFRPPIEEPPTPSSESGDSQLINMTVSDFEPQPDAVSQPHPHEQLFELQPKSSAAEQSEPIDQQCTPQDQSPALSPKSGKRAILFSPSPITLGRVWQSGSRNPISYATGLLNSATNLLDAHVHFIPRDRSQSDPVCGNEDLVEKESEDSAKEPEPQVTPTAPPKPDSDESSHHNSPPLSNYTPDVSCFLNRRWSGPNPPTTAMDKLIAMGFANRSLNECLLKKHNNHLPAVLNELLDTNGEGYMEAV